MLGRSRTALRAPVCRNRRPCCRGPLLVASGRAAAPPMLQARTLLTRRRTSFWAPSYPASVDAWVPATPPEPADGESLPPLPAPAVAPGSDEVDHRAKRKERYLATLMDKAGELGLKCSILDAHGNWTVEEGTYRKMDLCRAHDLDPRDLRKLDSLNPSAVPIILTRRSCILISILHIRALIKPDCVIIFNAPGTEESEAAKRFKAHLQANVRSGIALAREEREAGLEEFGLPYEHRALESILVDTANGLEEEMGFIRRLVEDLLENFEHDIDRENLRRLLHYSRRLAGFQSRAKYVKSAFDELLDSDEDLSAMYITDKVHGKPRALEDHEQLELLLESFTKQVEEIVSEIDTTVANMQSTQEVAELMLDSGRNALLALDIKVSIATLGIGSGALLAGVFGMNLTSQLEEVPYAFLTVSGVSGVLALMVFLWGKRVLKKVGHISLVSRPSSLPQSVREAKERFVRERAEHVRQLEAAAAAQCGAISAAATAHAQGRHDPQGIPDYETRWGNVRRGLRSRQSLWDRIFRSHSLRRSLLGMRRTPASAQWQPPAAGKWPAPKPHVSSAPASLHAPPSPMHSPGRPSARPHTEPSYARAISVSAFPNKAPPGVPPPSDVRVDVTPPSLAAIKEDGFYDDDVALLPPSEAVINLTSSAVAQLSKIAAGEPADSTLAFRVGVESGGCHGFQYIMKLDEVRGADDYVFQPAGALPVVCDLASLRMLKGATLDYATELIGSSFRIAHNPQAKDGGNCGCGVSWELDGQVGELK